MKIILKKSLNQILEKTLRLIDEIEELVNIGEIDEHDIDESVSLILKLKERFSIICPRKCE